MSRARHTGDSRRIPKPSRSDAVPSRRGARWSPRRHRVPGAPSRAVENAKRAARTPARARSATTRRRCPRQYPTYSRTETGLLFQDLRFGEGARVVPEKASPRTGTRTRSTCRTSCRRATCPRAGTSTAKTPSGFCGSSPGTARSSPPLTTPSRGCASAAFALHRAAGRIFLSRNFIETRRQIRRGRRPRARESVRPPRAGVRAEEHR